MSHEDSTGSQPPEPLRPTVYRIEEPPASPFGVFQQVAPPPPEPAIPRFPKLPLILFVLTFLSTWYTGMEMFSTVDTKGVITHLAIWEGLQYSGLVLAILGAHEMGHYLQSRRYGVPASLPMFIPMPFTPIGTMGAVIFQKPGVAARRAMFDIAISGPLAGLVLALPILCYGLRHAQAMTFSPELGSLVFADPLLIKLLTRWIHGPLSDGQDLKLNPCLFAGWVGVFITALNMFPLGQLDGGHILYTLLGRKSYPVVRILFRVLVFLAVVGGIFYDSGYFGWGLMLFLVWKTGVEHPPTADDFQPLGTFRKVLGWITLTFVFWGFIPRPISVNQPTAPRAKKTVTDGVKAATDAQPDRQ